MGERYEFGREAMASPGGQPVDSAVFCRSITGDVCIELRTVIVQPPPNMQRVK